MWSLWEPLGGANSQDLIRARAGNSHLGASASNRFSTGFISPVEIHQWDELKCALGWWCLCVPLRAADFRQSCPPLFNLWEHKGLFVTIWLCQNPMFCKKKVAFILCLTRCSPMRGRGVCTPEGHVGPLGDNASCVWLHWVRSIHVLIQTWTEQGCEGTLGCIKCSRSKAPAMRGASKAALQTWSMDCCFPIVMTNLTPSKHRRILKRREPMSSKNNLSCLLHQTDWIQPTALLPIFCTQPWAASLPGKTIFKLLLN